VAQKKKREREKDKGNKAPPLGAKETREGREKRRGWAVR